MIPATAITAWGVQRPWPTPEQVEQDLLLSRAICAIASDEYLGDELVFRGGTALHKLHLDRPFRYSEDLDYVRRTAGGIVPLTQALTRPINCRSTGVVQDRTHKKSTSVRRSSIARRGKR